MLFLEDSQLTKIRSTNRCDSPHGISSYFVPISDVWAAKVYEFKCDRDNHFDKQEKAAEYGLGPEVGCKFEFGEGYGKKYCYITEIVEVRPRQRKGCDSYSTEYDACKQAQVEFAQKINPLLDDLVDELQDKIDFEFKDIHNNNVGFKNGKLVCIDFGDES